MSKATTILTGGWVGLPVVSDGGFTIQDIVDALGEYGVATDADIAALGASSVTVINAVDGDTITVYRADTWSFVMTLSVNLSAYEAVALVVKDGNRVTDNAAVLYLRSDTGLQAIGGSAPANASNGTLTVDGVAITVKVAITETGAVAHGKYTWWLKVFDTTPATDEGYTRATGAWIVEPYGVRAIA